MCFPRPRDAARRLRSAPSHSHRRWRLVHHGAARPGRRRGLAGSTRHAVVTVMWSRQPHWTAVTAGRRGLVTRTPRSLCGGVSGRALRRLPVMTDTAAPLPAQLRHLIESDPAAARQAIDGLLLELHSLTTTATRTARKTGVNLEQVGRALRRVDEAVVLLHAAADLLLGALADTGRTRT